MPDAIDRLTAAMAAGDPKAVETFYRRYFDWLFAQARRATRRDEAFCLDVVQDAVLRIVRTVRRTESEIQFHAWMRLIIRTTALDRLRSEQRRARHELAAVATRSEVIAEQEPDDCAYERLKKEIERIDPQLVEMIEMRFEKRWTLARMSTMLGLSIGTIDGRIRRALRRVREQMVEDIDE